MSDGAKAAVFKLLAESERPTTYKLDSSPLLDKIKLFLPQIEEANKVLEDVPEKERNIEYVEEGVTHIQMNVGIYPCEDGDAGNMGDEEESEAEDNDIVIIRTPPTPRKDMIVDMGEDGS